TAPAAAGMPEAEEVVLDTSDGERVIVWHVPPRGQKPVVLYFHGNGASLRWRVDRLRPPTPDRPRPLAPRHPGSAGPNPRAHRPRSPQRRVGGLRLRAHTLPARAHRALGRVARLGRRGRTGGGETGRPYGARVAVHLRRGRRRRTILVRAGPFADEGPVPFRFAHRQGDGAGAGAPRRA